MSNFLNIAEDGHFVPLLGAQNMNGGGSTDVFSMKDYEHASIVVQIGANTVGGSVRLTVNECDDFTPTNSTPIAFTYYQRKSAAGDVAGDSAVAGVGGVHIGATLNLWTIIELSASELTDAFPNVNVAIEDPGAATYVNAFAILSGSRYSKETTKTAIA